MVSLDRGSSARVPLASQVEVVCALATNMALTDVLLYDVSDCGFELL